MATSQSISWTDIEREASNHLNHLVTINTGNPPAYELPAARYLLNVFEREGIPALIIPPVTGSGILENSRPSIVSHLPGTGVDEPILLLSHLDSAPSFRDIWDVQVKTEENIIRGAGALVGPRQTVSHAMAMILLARNNASLRRTVRFAATSEGVGGCGTGLAFLTRDYIEHITSDLAIAWGGLSWVDKNGEHICLLSTSDKGALTLRIRVEGTGGTSCIKIGKDPSDRLIRALNKLSHLNFAPKPSEASDLLIRSAAQILPDSKSLLLGDLLNAETAQKALEALEADKEIDSGLKTVIRASLKTEYSIIRLEAYSANGLKPMVAEADLLFSYPPGDNPEEIALKVIDTIGHDGVYLAKKEIQPPSESEITPEIIAMARASILEVEPKANLIIGPAPWPTGLGSFRKFGTSVFGWEPFTSNSPLSEVLMTRCGPAEAISINDLGREIRACYSFLCRIAK